MNYLNPIVRGWAQSKRNGTSTRTFSNLDNYLFRLFARWVKRQHPKKNWKWLTRRYFRKLEDKTSSKRKWVFFAPGTKKYVYFFRWLGFVEHVPVVRVNCCDDPEVRRSGYWKNWLRNDCATYRSQTLFPTETQNFYFHKTLK